MEPESFDEIDELLRSAMVMVEVSEEDIMGFSIVAMKTLVGVHRARQYKQGGISGNTKDTTTSKEKKNW